MKKIICILLLLLPTMWEQAQARNNFLGGDIEYKILGRDSVKIILKLYRNCSRTDTFPAAYTCYIKKISCNLSGLSPITVNRVFTKVIDVTCSTLGSRCDNPNSPFGVQLHQYEATVALNTIFSGGIDSNCCRLKVYFNECCRDSGITNMTPAVSPFYIETEFNRCLAPNNTSPKATQEPFFLLCNGMPFSYDHGFKDTSDNDSVVSVLSTPRTNETTLLTYEGAYHPQRSLQFLGFPNQNLPVPAGFHYYTPNGGGFFTSTAIQTPLMGYRIEEWRKINGIYQLIGTSYREFIFSTIQCPPNGPPVIRVNNSSIGPFNFSACAGTALCLDIVGTDRDSVLPMGPDTTVLSWDQSIASATFTNSNTPVKTKREDEGRFCWTPDASQISTLPYNFVISASEDNCPLIGVSKRTISIYVKGNVSHYSTKITKISKNTFALTAQKLNPQLPNATSFTWSVSSSPGTYKNPVTYMGATATHQFDSAGNYVVRLAYTSSENSPCTYYYFDTINADCKLSARIAPLSIKNGCVGDSIQFRQIDSASSGAVSYSWVATHLQTQQTNSFDTVNASTTFAPSTTGIWKISAIATDTVCAAEASIQIPVLSKPVASFSAAPLTGFPPLTTQFTNQSTGTFNKTQWSFGDTSTNSLRSFVPITYHSVWMKVTHSDSAGNSCSDSVYKQNYIRVKPPCTIRPRIQQRNLILCSRNGNQVFSATVDSAQGFPQYVWTATNTFTQQSTSTTGSGLFVPVHVPGNYNIKLQVTDTACTVSDSTVVTILPSPVANFTADKTSGQAPLTVFFSNLSSGASKFRWSFGDTTFNALKTFNAGTYSIWLNAFAKDSLGVTCKDSAFKANFIQVAYTSMAEIGNESLSMYPNPANSKLTIAHPQNVDIIRLYDMTGRMIFEYNNKNHDSFTSIDCSVFPDGVYGVTACTSSGQSIRGNLLIRH